MTTQKFFISYARADGETFAEGLFNDLTDRGFYVWWDKAAMAARGRTFLQEIQDAITKVDRVILVVTAGAAESDYVGMEWEYALSICKIVNPILISGDYNLVPTPLKNIDAEDFRPPRHYSEALKSFLRKLSEGGDTPGRLYAVPEMPPHFLSREAELARVRDRLLTDINQPAVVTVTAKRAGLQGMGGIGKTVLATAVARDCQIRRAFNDGVYWLTLGQTPLLTSLQSQLGEMLGDNPRNFGNIEDGKRRLNTLMVDKRCLLILDDVWEAAHASAFDALGVNCRMLITTRNAEPLRLMGIEETKIDVLSEEQALALLAEWSSLPVDRLPTEAPEIAHECGYLPLALSMIGAMLRNKPIDRWQGILQRLQKADLDKIKADFPYHKNLISVIQVSVEALDTHVRDRYFDFAVFPEDVSIPEVVLKTFWKPLGLDDFDTGEIIDQLVDRSLLRRDQDNRLRLHDLQVDYVRRYAPDKQGLHVRLLDAYNPTNAPWHHIPHDGYLYFHLAYHLRESGQEDLLHGLLTASPEWMNAKSIACIGDTSYVADLDFALAHGQYQGPLTPDLIIQLVELHTAKQLVNHRVGRYDDTALEALVLLKREAEALSHARLRIDPQSRFSGLLMIFKALSERKQPTEDLLMELKNTIGLILSKSSRASALSALALALAQAGQPDAAETVARSIEAANSRASALSDLATVLAQAGQPDPAARLFTEAETAVYSIETASKRTTPLRDLATAVAQAQLFDKAEGLARSIEDANNRAYALRVVSAAYARVHLFDHAEAVAHSIEILDRRVAALSTLSVALARANHAERAAILFVEAESFARSINTASKRTFALRILATSLAKAHLFSHAEAVARSIEDNDSRDSVLTDLVAVLAQTHLFEKAEAITNSIEDACCRTYALRSLAVTHAKANHVEQAANLFARAEVSVRSIKGISRRAYAQRTLATALAESSFIDQAEAITRTIEEASWRAHTLQILAIALAQAGQPDPAARLFVEAETVAHSIEAARSRASALSALARGLAQAGQPDAAETVARSIEDAGSRTSALRTLATALVQAGQSDPATRLFAEAETAARSIEDAGSRADALHTLATALVQAGQSDPAETVARSIEDAGSRADTLRTLATALAQAGQSDSAARLFAEAETAARSIEEAFIRADALSDLAISVAQAGQSDSATRLFAEAETVARSIEDAGIRASALSDLATSLTHVRSFDHTKSVARSIEAAGRRASPLRDLARARALAQAGQSDSATRLFAETETVARSIEDAFTRASALSDLAITVAQAGQSDSATRLFAEAETVARSIEAAGSRASALCDLAKVLAQTGKLLTTLRVLESISLDEFLQLLTYFQEGLRALNVANSEEVFRQLLIEAMRIAGWEQPGWKRVYNSLIELEEHQHTAEDEV